ncbi:hypothetical protein Tco_0252045 [Tanacetum coccineum]
MIQMTRFSAPFVSKLHQSRTLEGAETAEQSRLRSFLAKRYLRADESVYTWPFDLTGSEMYLMTLPQDLHQAKSLASQHKFIWFIPVWGKSGLEASVALQGQRAAR